MNRKELCANIARGLRESQTKKPLRKARHVLHISDDYGNQKDFVVHHAEKEVIYTQDDIENVIDMLIEVVKESLRRGESVSIAGFGRFGLNYRKPRATKIPKTDKWVEIEGHSVPKFTFGQHLKACAVVYDEKRKDELNKLTDHSYDESADPTITGIQGE